MSLALLPTFKRIGQFRVLDHPTLKRLTIRSQHHRDTDDPASLRCEILDAPLGVDRWRRRRSTDHAGTVNLQFEASVLAFGIVLTQRFR